MGSEQIQLRHLSDKILVSLDGSSERHNGRRVSRTTGRPGGTVQPMAPEAEAQK